MRRSKYTVQEWEALTPAEREAIFTANVVTDLDTVPAEYLARVRADFEAYVSSREMPSAS